MKGRIYEMDGGYRVVFGRDVRKRFRSKEEAERFLTGLRYETDKGVFDRRDYSKSNQLSFAKQADLWLQVRAKEVKPNTLRDYRTSMAKAKQAFGHLNVKVIAYSHLEDFLLGLECSGKTRHNVRSALSQFFTWLSRREKIPVPDMPEVEYELGWREVIDLETQARIIDEVRRIAPFKAWLGIRWLARYIAIRPNEMRNLRECDIDMNGMFVIPHPKEKKPKLVPMLPEDIELFRSLPRSFPMMPFFRHEKGNGAAKPGAKFGRDHLYNVFKRACANLGIEGVDLYGATRHSGATALGGHFTAEEIQKSGTFHASNKAFLRYFQHQTEPSRRIAETLVALSEAKERRKVENGND